MKNMIMLPHNRYLILAAVMLAAALIPLPASAQEPYPAVEPLLDTRQTILGQDFDYPAGDARVTALIVTMAPGETTEWHVHDVPLYGYVLSGAVTVDYGTEGVRTFQQGDSWIEAIGASHQGRNETGQPVRILAVFIGADDDANTRGVDQPLE